MKEDLLNLFQEQHHISGGHCGIKPPELMEALDADWQTIRPVLMELFKEKKIKYHPNPTGNIFRWNAPKHQP